MQSKSVYKPNFLQNRVLVRRWKNLDIDAFRSDLQSSHLFSLKVSSDNASNLAQLVSTYYSVLSSLVNKHAPLVLLKPCSRSTVPWFNRDISNAIRERRRCERIWRRTRCESDRSHFVTQRNYVQLLIRRAKLSHYSNIVSNSTCNAKSVWPAIRSLLCRKKSPILPSHVSKSDLPSAFAEHFHAKISSIRDNLLPSCMERIGGTNCTEKTCLSQFSDVTVTETESVMLSMKPTSCSLDPAPTWLVKMFISDLAPIFCSIANLSLQSGIFPDSEKRAVVTPLIKKGRLCKNSFVNYRPISSLSFLSKFIERLVARRMTNFLRFHNLFSPFQSAYRKGHSTETVLTHLFNALTEARETHRSSCVTFLDLSAAFDTVDHVILLERLSYPFNVNSIAHNWFSSYLSHRYQRVIIDGLSSSWCEVKQGVPQGSVLGPLLFTLYISPISDLIFSFGLSHHTVYMLMTFVYFLSLIHI